MIPHVPKDSPQQGNNPPLPSPIVTETSKNTTSSIEEWHTDDHQNGPMTMIKQHNHASYVIII
jgi:hypothetical protein